MWKWKLLAVTFTAVLSCNTNAASIFAEMHTGAELATNANVVVHSSSSSQVVGDRLVLSPHHVYARMLTWSFLEPGTYGDLIIDFNLVYEMLPAQDNDFSFGLTDGTTSISLQRLDSSHDPQLRLAESGQSPVSVLRHYTNASLVDFHAAYVIEASSNAVAISGNEGTSVFSNVQPVNGLNADNGLAFFMKGDNTREAYGVDWLSLEVHSVSSVPTPAALPLLGSVLLGWSLARGRNRRRTRCG